MSRRLLVPSLIAAACALAMGWLGLTGFVWSDYELATLPPMQALMAGDWGTFFDRSSIEGPSLLLRAPFALTVHLWDGGDLAVYRMMAVPGLAAAAVLGVLLWSLRRRLYPHARWALLFVFVAAANPVTVRALDIGHPEEILGAVFCIGAVLAALADRPWLSAVLLGLALGNKAWAVLAIGPVLIALRRDRIAVLMLAGAIGAAFVAPFVLAGEASRGAIGSAAATTGVFQPWQVWWFLGEHGHEITGFFGVDKEGYRAAPAWISHVTHPLIAALVVPASVAFWRRRGAGTGSPDVLLLLAALFLARCALDVANNVYYHLPFLLTLLAWEAVRADRPPVLSLLATAAVWVTFEELTPVLSPDAQSAVYVLWAVPALVALTVAALRRPGAPVPLPAAARLSPATA